MAETIEQKTPSDVNNGDKVSANDKAKKSSNMVLIGLILLLTLASGLAWLFLQQKKLNDDFASKLSNVEASLMAKDQQAQAIATANEQLKQQLSALESQHQLLAEKLDIVSDNQTLSAGDVKQFWTLSEVDYLLNIANQRVLLQADVVGAQASLAMADELVKDLNDHRLHPLRELLAQEQLALASVAKPDVQGMALQLSSALNTVDRLHVLMAAPTSDSEQALSILDVNDWQGIASSAWQQIKSLVVIRNQQNGSAAVLIPEQRYFLYQNLKLKLEAARLALLQANNTVYKDSLAASIDWLETYFVGDKRDAMVAMLKQLQVAEVTVTLPDISGSATWLKGFE